MPPWYSRGNSICWNIVVHHLALNGIPLQALYHPDKMNIAAIGNVVSDRWGMSVLTCALQHRPNAFPPFSLPGLATACAHNGTASIGSQLARALLWSCSS